MKNRRAMFFLLSCGLVVPLASCKKNDDKNQDQSHKHQYSSKYDATSHWEECECGDIKNKVNHTIVLDSTDPATCADTKHDHMKCSLCDYVYVVEGDSKLPHAYNSTIKTPATCVSKGVKHYECANCHESFDLDYEDYNSHAWNSGVVNDGVTTYTCIHCQESYSVLDYSNKKEATVTTEALSQAGGIQLQTATIQLDADTIEALDANVSISAETVKSSEVVNIIKDEESKKLIENAPVFDFSMKNGDEDVHEFAGLVTVTVPYSLKEGENPDDISIAYIPDDGSKLEHISGHYNAGNVSFETSHFSKYAIVKLTAEEACQEFGHNTIKTKSGKSTCVSHGYDTYSCTRCGAQTLEELPLIEHDFVYSKTEPSTTTEHGYIENKCSVCGEVVHEELPLIPESNDNYVMNLVKSLLDSNFLINASETEASSYQEFNAEIVFAPNASTPFITLTDKESTTSNFAIIGNKEYTYRSLVDDKDTTMSTILKVFNQIKAAPEAVETVVNFVFDAIYRTLLTKTTKDGFDIYTIDFDKVRGLVEAVKTEKVVKVVDMIFGEGFYDKIYSFVSNCFTRTVKETLDYLKSEKLDVEQILDFIGILSGGQAPKYADIFTADVLKMNTFEFIQGLVPVDLSEINKMSKIDEFINQYKDKTIKEIIGLIVDTDLNEIFEQIDEFIEIFEEALQFEIKLTSFGQFVSADVYFELTEALADATEAAAEIGSYVSASVKTSFDVEAELAKAQAQANKIDKAMKAFTEENIAEKLCEYAEYIYGVEFTYYPEDEYGNPFIESVKSSEITRALNDDVPPTSESKLRIYFDADFDYTYLSSFNDLHNVYGFKDNRTLPAKSIYCYCREIIFDTVSEASYTISVDSCRLEVVYNFETEDLFIAREQDHLFNTTEITKTEFDNILRTDTNVHGYGKYWGYGDEEPDCYYKRVCKICGEITLAIASKNYDFDDRCDGLVTDKMNKEALTYLIDIRSGEQYNSNVKDGYIACKNLTTISVQQIFGNTTYLGSSSSECDFKNRTYHFGNVDIAYTYSRVSGSNCKINETITIKVANEVVGVYKNALHFSSNAFSHEHVDEKDEGCYHYWHYEITCNDCNECVYKSDTYCEEHHDYSYERTLIETDGCGSCYHIVVTCNRCHETLSEYDSWTYDHHYEFYETVHPGYLFESYDVYKCRDCDAYIIRNTHFEQVHNTERDSETGLYHCEACDQDYLLPYHYHFELLNQDHYNYQYHGSTSIDDLYVVGVRDLTSNYSNWWIELDDSWDCYIGLVSYDEEGQIVFGEKFDYEFTNYGYVAYLKNYENYPYFYDELTCPILTFDKNQIDSLLESANENETLSIIFVHKYENGLIQIYDFPPIE